MNDEKIDTEKMLRDEQLLSMAVDELRVKLNAIIARYQLHPSVVLSLLARFTAGYIHLTQKMYNHLI